MSPIKATTHLERPQQAPEPPMTGDRKKAWTPLSLGIQDWG